jgi:ATP-dependent exoDNAse (exonuclease V) beta subunit
VTPAALLNQDQESRRIIREELDRSLIVEASAGTGKTTELVNRIVAVLRAGCAEIEKIVAVTFTNKAAGELKLRLRQELDRVRQGATGEEAERLERALERLEEAAIGTIHSFCAQLLRERPVEACIDPAFEEVSEEQAEALYARAFRLWIEDALNRDLPGLRRALTRLSWRESWETGSPIEQLQYAGRKLIEWRDFEKPWRREPFDRKGEIEALVEQARILAKLSQKAKSAGDVLFKGLQCARLFASWVENAERAQAPEQEKLDTLEALLLKLARDIRQNDRKGSGKYGEVSREDLVERREALYRDILDFKKRADADLAALLQQEMRSLVECYDERKRRTGAVDFSDLLIRARDLVKDHEEVRKHFRSKFTHLFVDEFQDTDPLQAELLLLLSSDDPNQTDWLKIRPRPGALFLVGDPKQSIYKFRRADVVLYQDITCRLREQGVGFVRLSTSYRSVRPIQECVNAAFETAMQESLEFGQAAYSPLGEKRPRIEGQPSVVALPVPHPYSDRGNVTKWAVEKSLPDTICAYVEWLIHESGWQVEDLEKKQLTPIKPSHIAILFRRFLNFNRDLTRDYVKSLEARNIPHLLVGSKSFHSREEVETLRSALTAVEWPDDELSVYATLRGSLFAIPDHLLFRYRARQGALNPIRAPKEIADSELMPIVEALALLKDLHRNRNRRPFADTAARLLEYARAHAGFVARPGGQQVLANVRRIADVARNYEASGGISFRGLVDTLNAEAEKARSQEAPVHEEGSDGVRLMTVHSAKGLEFPVVILADSTANLAAQEPDRYIDPTNSLCATRLLRCAPWELLDHEAEERQREKNEGIRVAYVAATRARDLLVVPAIGVCETQDWLSPLNHAIYPEPARWKNSRSTDGCPEFGGLTIIDDRGADCVKPGLHLSAAETEVVWWDPHLLRLKAIEKESLNPTEVFAKDNAAAIESLREYREWQAARSERITKGAVPEWTVRLATEATVPPPGAESIAVESARVETDRLGGRRFGSLLHAVLRDARDGAELERLAALHGRLLGASQEEIVEASAAAARAFAHPLLERSRQAAEAHPEWPVLARINDGELFEGVIDLLFREGDVWHVVDFKTDNDLEQRRAIYEVQVQWYVWAVQQITGQPAKGWLLAV